MTVVTDNDDPGEQFGRDVTARLFSLRPDIVVKILRVSDEPKGDIVEAIRDGMTKAKFLELVEQPRLSPFKQCRQ